MSADWSSSATWLCSLLPLLTVWLVGGAVAIARWSRHPQVSALLVLSLGLMLLAAIGTHMGVQFVVRSSPSSFSTYVAFIGLVGNLMRTVAWGVILTAIFGWRTTPGDRQPAWQFSIRGLLILTFVVAVLFGLGRTAMSWLGAESGSLIALVDDLPANVCLLVGGWLAISRRRRHSAVSALTLTATALHAGSLALFHLVWLSNLTSSTVYLVGWVVAVSGIVGPCVWALLLIAALGWRGGESPFGPRTADSRPQMAER